MHPSSLELLRCPICRADTPLALEADGVAGDGRELREGSIRCTTDSAHRFAVADGIMMFGTGLDDPTVLREISYEDSSYYGDPCLRAPDFIGGMPETGASFWPHTRHFGTDFEQLVDALDIGPGDLVLDVGTGACWTSRMLAERGARIVAMDVNASPFYGLRAADIQFAMHEVYFERVLASMSVLPFRSRTFDHVVFNASFHHTPDLSGTLGECRRVLRPGGSIAMTNEEFTSLRHWLAPGGQEPEEGAHHSIPYRILERSARDLGFRVEYRIARRVRGTLALRIGRSLSGWIVNGLQRMPFVVKQLGSALVFMTRPSSSPARKRTAPIRPAAGPR
jgi:SAM-dependent methyltransferase